MSSVVGARTGRLDVRTRGLGPRLLPPLPPLGRDRAGAPDSRRGGTACRRAHGCHTFGALLHAACEVLVRAS
eukprot:15444980-Alexandrium_andersonii.AAC.1